MKENRTIPTPRRRRKDQEPLTPVVGTPATVPSAMGDIPKALENLAIEPTHEDIARRAYQLYEDRGGDHGRDWQDWFRAERELRELALRAVVDRALGTEGSYVAA